MNISVASLLTLFLLLLCRPVAAEKAAVLNPDADRTIKADLVELTQWLIADWLRERGVEPLMPQDAAAGLSDDLIQCRTLVCASRYLDNLKSADYAVFTKLTKSGEGSAMWIEVVLVSRDGARYQKDWPVGKAIEAAVDAALTHAYTAFLQAQSKRAHGETPDKERDVDLNAVTQPQADTSEAAIDPYLDQPESRSSVWNYIIGGTLLAASVPLFIAPIYWATLDDECKEEDEKGACIRYHFSAGNIVELSLAGASLLTGAFFILFEPITVEGELSVGDGQGVVRLRGAF